MSWHSRIARITVARASIDASLRLYTNYRNNASSVKCAKEWNPEYSLENSWSRVFSVTEFKVASLNRYFENVRYQIADSVKFNIYPQDALQGYVTRETNGKLLLLARTRLLRKRIDYMIADVACEFTVSGK